MKSVVGAALFLVVLTSCSADTVGTSTTGPEGATTAVEPPPRAPSVNLNEIPEWFQNEDAAPAALVDVIAGDLGAEYVGSMAMIWPNGGIGCSSGGNELQVVTSGYVIFFEKADGSPIRVHSADTGRWVECDLWRELEGIPVLNS